MLKTLIRRSTRLVLRIAPASLRQAARRVPFSRFHAWPARLVGGEDTSRWNRLTVMADPGETGGYFLYFFGECWSPDEHELAVAVEAVKSSGGPVLDIGANAGMWSLGVAQACPDVQLLSVEPDPRMVRRFRRTLDLNPDLRARIEVVPAACGATAGEVRFQTGRAHAPETGHLVTGAAQAGTVTVSCCRADELCARRGLRPMLVKIDVEGAERDVLDGMSGLLSQGYPRTLMVEAHGFAHPADPGFTAGICETLRANYHTVLVATEAGWAQADTVPRWASREQFLARDPIHA